MPERSSSPRPNRRRLRRIAALAACASLCLIGLDRLCPPDLSRYQAVSPELRARDGTLLSVLETADGHWRLRANVADVDPRYVAMLSAYEDKRFLEHLGVDPLAVTRAAAQWIGHGRIVSGASTLTMQVARLLQPHPRTIRGKLVEMARAVQLEARYSKTEILDMYLTLAPFGGNLDGVRAASLAYFGKEPTQLTIDETALLVALPQSPTRRRPDRHPEMAFAARDKVLALVGASEPSLIDDAGQAPEPISSARRPFPSIAPYVARRLAHGRTNDVILSTLDAGIQGRAEALATASGLDAHASIAIMVIDNRSREVLASVGGRGLSAPGGYVDMTQAVRSPGSTLKPFIYGLAFDDLAIHPETLIEDTAMQFADYAPRDFDGQFHGLVTVREALQQSLNIPAIALMQRVGPGRLATTLTGVGARLKLPKSSNDPGLAIALGGVGISLNDLTMLYVGLADGGAVSPLVERRDHPVAPGGHTLLSPIADYYVTSILANSPMPDGLAPAALVGNGGRIAWKTGTSYGFRDAWAVGYSDRYTVGVWVGRVEGTPRPGSYGRNTAAPLMFKAFDSLPQQPGAFRLKAPPGVIRAASNGDLPRGLRYFTPRNRQKASNGPRILYPPAASTLDLVRDPQGGWKQVQISAEGGTPPLRVFVNGRPLTAGGDSRRLWKPDGPGFATLTVIDDRDSRAVSRFRLAPAE